MLIRRLIPVIRHTKLPSPTVYSAVAYQRTSNVCDDVIQEGKKKRFWCERSLEDYRFFRQVARPTKQLNPRYIVVARKGIFLLFSLNAHPDTKNLGVK
jgi:hypothetical protein